MVALVISALGGRDVDQKLLQGLLTSLPESMKPKEEILFQKEKTNKFSSSLETQLLVDRWCTYIYIHKHTHSSLSK